MIDSANVRVRARPDGVAGIDDAVEAGAAIVVYAIAHVKGLTRSQRGFQLGIEIRIKCLVSAATIIVNRYLARHIDLAALDAARRLRRIE